MLAVVAAAACLEPVAAAAPAADVRILVLSDGQSNTGASAQQALDAARSVGATVDAIVVGDSADAALRKLQGTSEQEMWLAAPKRTPRRAPRNLS